MGHGECCCCGSAVRIASNAWSRQLVRGGDLWALVTNKLRHTKKRFQYGDLVCLSCNGKLKGDHIRNKMDPYHGIKVKVTGKAQQSRALNDDGPFPGFDAPSSEPFAVPESVVNAVNTSISQLSMSSIQSVAETSTSRNSQMSLAVSVTSSNSIVLEMNKAIIKIPAVAKSERRCFVCLSPSGRCRIPESALLQVLRRSFIFVPQKNRCCASHLANGRFTEASFADIKANKDSFTLTGDEITQWISTLVDALNKQVKFMDFGVNSPFSNDEFFLLLGLTIDQFQDLVKICDQQMKNTEIRSVVDAVALFFMMIRLDLSQKVLQLLFGINSQQNVSRIIHSVADCLDKDFVPQNLGFGHLSREDASGHDSEFFSKVLESKEGALHTIWDATYINIQKPSNHEFQRRTYNPYKHRNLLKPMIGCFADGYILESAGPYLSDASNNDASILSHMLSGPVQTDMTAFLRSNDVFIVDRGFRDVVEQLEAKGFKTFMPNLVRGNQQFSAIEANQSRRVTMCRLVVEIVNGQLKQRFRFFDGVVHALYVDSIPAFFRIAVAVHNKYGKRFRKSPENEEFIASKVLQDLGKANELEAYVEEHGLQRKRVCWKLADDADLEGFPALSMDDLKKITLGTFQIKMSDLYSNQHLEDGTEYEIFVHKESDTLFRVKLQSRFARRTVHQVWIRVDVEKSGFEGIGAYYCTCKTGSRTLGSCSHVCSVMKYVGFDRHQPQRRSRRPRTLAFLDAAVDYAGNENEGAVDEEVLGQAQLMV